MIADLLTKARLVKFSAAAIVTAMTLAVCTPSLARAEVIDRVLAVVGGQLITLTDVIAARDLRLVPAQAAPDPIPPAPSKLLDREPVPPEVAPHAPPDPPGEPAAPEARPARARCDPPQALG